MSMHTLKKINPGNTAQCAKELIAKHGDQAKSVAEAYMRQQMEAGDVKLAGEWLAVMHEIHKMASYHVN